MGKKFSVVTLAVLAFAFASAARSNAGTEIVRDYSANAPTYNYAPPPPPPPAVYYAPPPVRVVVYQTYRYCPPVRVVAYHRFYPRRVVYCR